MGGWLLSLFIIVVCFLWLVGKLARLQTLTVQALEALVYAKIREWYCFQLAPKDFAQQQHLRTPSRTTVVLRYTIIKSQGSSSH